MTTVRTLLTTAALAFAAATTSAADLNINNRGDDKKFIANLTTDLIKTARGSPKDVAYVEHAADDKVKDRLKWTIKGSYKGSLTGKQFESDIVVVIDTANAKKWEVLTIEYADNNKTAPVGPSKANVEKLRATLNK